MLEYNIENKELDYSMKQPEEFEFDTPKTEVNKDYNKLENKPQINGVKLIGNKTTEDLGIKEYDDTNIRNLIGQKQDKSKMVTEIDASSDNEHYPTAKSVYSFVNNKIGDVDSLLTQIDTGSGV